MSGSDTRSGGVERREAVQTDRTVRESAPADAVMRTCPNCGAELRERQSDSVWPYYQAEVSPDSNPSVKIQ